jgi:hypothetical protein
MVSIGIWFWIVIRLVTDFLATNVSSDVIWINSALFLAAGIGVVATTHFAASALPLFLGVMTVTAVDVKGGAVWSALYVLAATAIGFVAIVVRLFAWLTIRLSKAPAGEPK